MNIEFTKFLELLKVYNVYAKQFKEFGRSPNFPEVLSENMVKFFINNYERRKCYKSSVGDLIDENNKRIEVKCFSSSGPSSFGPKEKWDELWFVDATQISNEHCKLYKCSLPYNSTQISSLMVNKNTTFDSFRNVGKRPRILFSSIVDQLKDDIKLVFDDHVFRLNINNLS